MPQVEFTIFMYFHKLPILCFPSKQSDDANLLSATQEPAKIVPHPLVESGARTYWIHLLNSSWIHLFIFLSQLLLNSNLFLNLFPGSSQQCLGSSSRWSFPFPVPHRLFSFGVAVSLFSPGWSQLTILLLLTPGLKRWHHHIQPCYLVLKCLFTKAALRSGTPHIWTPDTQLFIIHTYIYIFIYIYILACNSSFSSSSFFFIIGSHYVALACLEFC